MIIYNTSYLIENSMEKEFCEWMKIKFIPLLKETGTFSANYFCKVMVATENEGLTYSLQLLFKSKELFTKYHCSFEPRAKAVFEAKYRNQVMSFSSLLEEA
ncbi:hypothetical protein BZG01_15520 [Labilibaculum manganireducens]|uniref:DUF4286 domain-containing protein n=1 Tax=Labilibaculum manganireducens TaxID=1940525 RepID=A0A2N3I070_9BACT|nr:DUF4286 family protein [Labilibaculum manganireducens]PKQ63720.1 hypothetical protein BZG01_15520 [Labilibaculum manganireducens]